MHQFSEIFRRSLLGALQASLIVTLAGASSAGAADWPQWRGPLRDGVCTETGLLKSWPAQGPQLLWKAGGLGGGYSTVSVVGERIYTSGENADGSFVAALSRTEGKVLWTARLGRAGAPGWGGFAGPRATPTIDGELLFAVGQWGELVCLDRNSGKELWRKDFVNDFGSALPEWGFSESPLVDGAQVVVTPGGPAGAIVALNKKTGAVVWRTKDFTDPAHYSSLIPAEIGGVRQYIQLTAASVVGVAATDGKVLWKTARPGSTAVIPTPIYKDGIVYVASGYNIGCNAFGVTAAHGSFSVQPLYANKDMVNQHGGVVLVNGFLYGYCDNKGWTCEEFQTGKVRWQEKSGLGKGSVLYADGCLYLRQEDKQGAVALIEASPAGYREHGRFNQPERTAKNAWSHPVISGGRLYLRDQDTLLCYDVQAK